MEEVVKEERDEGREFGLPPELVPAVCEALERSDGDAVRTLVEPLHAADVAELLEHLQGDDRRRTVEYMGPVLEADVFAYLDPAVREELVEHLAPKELAAAVGQLDTDDAVGLLEDLDEERRAAILAELEPETRTLVEQGLTYPEYSAGRLMQRDLVAVPVFWTVGKTIDYLRAATELPDDFYDIFVVDPMHRLVGSVPLSRVLRSRRDEKIERLVGEDLHTIDPRTDQEEVAYLFRKYGLVSAPVVDKARRLLGIVTVDDVVDVIDEEAEEDLFRLSRVGNTDFHLPMLETFGHRVRWLIVTLANTILASYVISNFEATIQEIVVLAVLMPIVAAMGGNAGMQVVTVTVRALATREMGQANIRRVVLKELSVGALNGLIFAAIMGTIAALWFGNVAVAGVLAAAMIFNMIWAGLAGTLIPLALQKIGVDPAVAAGPFLTTTTDVFGFFIFLGLATWLLL